MKILYVDQFGKTTGRDTLALAELINQHQDIDMQVYLSEATEIPADRTYSVKIIKGFKGCYEGNALSKIKTYWYGLQELKKYIIKNRIDIVHLQWFSLPWIEWSYVDSLKKYCKVVITVHDLIPFDKRPLEIQSLDKIYKRADRLLVHTNTVREKFSKFYSAKTPIEVITPGFCNKSDYHILDKAEAREKLGIPKDKIVFLYYGTIRPSKGLKLLIKAIGRAQKKYDNIFLLAAGSCHNTDENEYKELIEKCIKRDGVIANFGFVPFELEKYYFSASDVLVLPYYEGTQSGVAQLGLMYELPIIASNIDAFTEVIDNGKNGIIYQNKSLSGITGAIEQLAGDKRIRKLYSECSRTKGLTEFSLNIKADRVYESYKRCI